MGLNEDAASGKPGAPTGCSRSIVAGGGLPACFWRAGCKYFIGLFEFAVE